MNGVCYKIGYIVGGAIGKLIRGFFKLMWSGIVTASGKCKPLLFTYIGLTIATFVSALAFQTYGFMVMVILVVACGSAFWVYTDEKPYKDRVKYFNQVFNEINLKSRDDSLPVFLYEKNISDYAILFVFRTLIPISDWHMKREQMEMYFNTKIIEIKQDTEDNREIHVIVQKENLPDYIEYNGYVDKQNDVLNIGIGLTGLVGMDLQHSPHAFIAGETGSGKSNLLKCMLYQAFKKGYEIVLIDFKRGVSFAHFGDMVTLIYEYEDARNVLEEMVEETKRRLDSFREMKVDNINDYNRYAVDPFQRKIIFIDELAELLKTRDKELSNSLYDSLETLTRLSRAVGIHLIMGIQRPDSTVVNGQIKNNVPFRVCGRFVDREPSRIMLGCDHASSLPNIKGRFIVKGNDMQEVQCFYYDDNCTILEEIMLSKETEERKEEANTEFDVQEREESTAVIPEMVLQAQSTEVEKQLLNKETPIIVDFDFHDVTSE